MNTSRVTVLLAAMLLAGCASGTYVGESQRAGFQNGSSTQQQVQAELGKPSMTAGLVSGGRRDTYIYHEGSTRPVDLVPLLGLIAGSNWPHTTTVTFDYNPQGVLVASASQRTRG